MLNDFRYAIRGLRRSPAFTAIAIATLALGIGANTAIFSVVNGVLLRPLPFGDPERLVQVWTVTAADAKGNHAAADFLDLQRENQSLQAIAGYRRALFTASTRTEPGAPLQYEGTYVTVDFFDVLQTAPSHGRLFSRAEDAGSREASVVLSRAAWDQLFGSTPDAIGQRVRLNGEAHTVVGVLAPGAEWPEGSKLWILSSRPVPPSPLDIQNLDADRDVRYFEAIARLKPEVSLAQAQDDLRRLTAVLGDRHSDAQSSELRDIGVGRLREEIVGDVRPALLFLQASVGLVLLIACANVSSLFIARATGRRRELTIRAALGAGRGRLVRLLLTESLVLGVIGGLSGLLAGGWLMVLLMRVLPEGVPRAEHIALDRVVALVTMVAAIASGVLFGILPALQASRADGSTALKSSGERTTAARARTRRALVVAEVALTLVLLAGAGLLINSLLRLQRVDSGFKADHVTMMSLAVPQSRYPTGESQAALYQRIVEGLERRPEVQAVGVGFPGPLRGDNASGSFFIEGRSSGARADRSVANIGAVSGGYFRAVGIPLMAGRAFLESDTAKAPGVAIVSAALARKYWPGENAAGKRLRFETDGPWITVVGIVADARQLGLREDPPPVLYIPYKQFPIPFTNLAVRSSAPESVVASLMRTQVIEADPTLPAGEVSTLRGILDKSIAEPRFRTLLLAAFAAIALVLATVGVYGLISYSVAQQTREIGIRVALGALPRQVLVPVVREGLSLAVIGIALGLAGALATARVLSRFLFGISATDPLTFGAVSVGLLAVALLASYLPSRRALRIDPVIALRTE